MIAYVFGDFDDCQTQFNIMYHNDEFWINIVKETSAGDKEIIFKFKQPTSTLVTDECALFNLLFSSRGSGDMFLLYDNNDDDNIIRFTFAGVEENAQETREFFYEMCSYLKHIRNNENDIYQLSDKDLPKHVKNMITQLRN